MNYNEKLDILFDAWEKESRKEGLQGFCRDGLMYKGEQWSSVVDGQKYIGRKSSNENILWHNAKKRVLFLMKDTNSNPNQDYREWMGRQNESIITNKFFKNIALWFYGILEIDENGSYPKFEAAFNIEKITKTFDEEPLAIVNCKKESGGSSISDSVLWEYCSKYQFFLKQQIDILKPNIIFCGGGSYSVVLSIVTDLVYPELNFEKINNWIYLNEQYKLILINGYHPSARKSYESMYTGMMESYCEFLQKKGLV